MTLESHSEFKMQFKIEQQPDGTFLGRCDQPHLEIRGATHDEVLKKIQESLGSRLLGMLGMEATAALEGGGVKVTVNKRFSVVRRNADGTVEDLTPSSSTEAPERTPTLPKPIDSGSFISQELMTVFLVLAGIGLLVWWFFLHR